MIWQRYLLKKTVRTFIFFLGLSFLLFVLIDLTIHGTKWFSLNSIPLFQVSIYYLAQFSTYLDLFTLLCFLLTLQSVLTQIGEKGELLAFQVGGLSKQKLLSPLFGFALLLTLALYANQEWVIPKTKAQSALFKEFYQPKKANKKSLSALVLPDGSKLIYRTRQLNPDILFDVFWVLNETDLWHIKELRLPDQAHHVDIFTRDKENRLIKKKSVAHKKIENLSLNTTFLQKLLIPIQSRPLSHLFEQKKELPSQKAKISAHLCYKMTLPLLLLPLLFGISAQSMQPFRGRSSVFFRVTTSLFAFFLFLALFNGQLLLAEHGILSPLIALVLPFFLCLQFSLFAFFRFR